MTYSEFVAEWHSPEPVVTASTSGSTGKPKAIELAKADMRLSAEATIKFFDIRPADILATPLAADYIAGKMMAVRSILAGAELHTEEPSRTPFTELAGRVKLAAIVPQQIEGTIEAPCSFSHIIVGGAPVPPELEGLALDRRPDISWWATYGMTETCSHIALRCFGTDSYTPLPGISLAMDSRDCLIIAREGATWSPVVTNDIVSILPDGSFTFHGRADNAIMSGGLKIHPEEVERLIAPALDSRRYYIIGVPSVRWGSEPMLVVEGKPDADGGAALLAACASLAGHVKRPRSICFIQELAMTPTGKIKRMPPPLGM